MHYTPRSREVPLLVSLLAAAHAAPPVCVDGALVDLSAHPTVTVDPNSSEALLTIEGGKNKSDGPVDSLALGGDGFTATGWTFSAAEYLERKGIPRAALEKGGFLRLTHGLLLESEGSWTNECLLTYDMAPVEVRLAEEKLAAAKKKAAMQSVMVCDPEGSRDHAIKAPRPAAALSVPPGQAAQGEGTLLIGVSTADGKPLGQQTVRIAGGKFVSATTTAPGLFCPATSFADLCVDTEAAFALTKDAPFDVDTEVDWYEMVLSRCTVSR